MSTDVKIRDLDIIPRTESTSIFSIKDLPNMTSQEMTSQAL